MKTSASVESALTILAQHAALNMIAPWLFLIRVDLDADPAHAGPPPSALRLNAAC